MNKQQLEAMRDHCKAIMDLGGDTAPATYLAMVQNLRGWCNKGLDLITKKEQPMPALDAIRVKVSK